MKWSFATVGVILIGIFGVSIILLFQNVTTTNENDYYLLKEVTEAAMIDAIDISYYRETGDLKIVKEKFVENFTRRYAESTLLVSGGYDIYFYDIMETPPKVSIFIDTNVGRFSVVGNVNDYNVQNKLDAILEYTGVNTYATSGSTYYNNPYTSKTYVHEYYAMPGCNDSSCSFNHSLKLPYELVAPNIKNVKIASVSYVGGVTSQGELGEALLNRELSFNVNTSTDYTQYINDFDTNVIVNDKSFYNCGTSTSDYVCDDINKYWISFNVNASDAGKSKAIFKYRVTWSYDEYEFS